MTPEEWIEEWAVLAEKEDDPEELAAQLVRLRELKRQLAIVEKETERAYITSAGEKQLTFQGLGTFEVMGKKDRKAWQHDELWREVVMAAKDAPVYDPETGEKLDDLALIDRILATVWATFNPTWRVKALDALGIDPDEFCESSWGGHQVKIIG